MIDIARLALKTAKVLAVSSAIVGDNMNSDLITCLGERQ